MKKHSITAGAILLFLLLPGLSPADVPPPEAAAAAEFGLSRFLGDLPAAELPNFGFAEGEDLTSATVGEPWLLYTIHPDSLLSASPATDVGGLITPTGLWYFPAVLGGNYRAVVTVDWMDDQWEAVAFGAAPLAGELEKISRQWPRAKGYTPRLVAIYQAAAYFFTVPQKDSPNLTPLVFDGVGFGGYQPKSLPEYSDTADLGDLLGTIQKAVRENIAAFRSLPEGGGE